jgi:hypothetical protein
VLRIIARVKIKVAIILIKKEEKVIIICINIIKRIIFLVKIKLN